MNINDATEVAYKKGYAHARAEVAREIFEEIEQMCIDIYGNFHYIVFAELKKKYTEEKP